MRNLKILAKILANSVHMDVAFEAVSTASCDGKMHSHTPALGTVQ